MNGKLREALMWLLMASLVGLLVLSVRDFLVGSARAQPAPFDTRLVICSSDGNCWPLGALCGPGQHVVIGGASPATVFGRCHDMGRLHQRYVCEAMVEALLAEGLPPWRVRCETLRDQEQPVS